MAIAGLQNMSREQINFEIQQGATFVRYSYCISVLVLTFKRSSMRFVRAEESRVMRGLPYTLISLFCGWWGIPWGPIWTIQALFTNFRGGQDITQELRDALAPRSVAPQIVPVQGVPAPLAPR